jgi:hypothetical protein
VEMRYFQPCTWLCQDAAPGRCWFNASPAVCTVKIAASSRSSTPRTSLRAPQAARKRMVLSLWSYLKKARKRLGIVKAVWRWETSSITSLWMCSTPLNDNPIPDATCNEKLFLLFLLKLGCKPLGARVSSTQVDSFWARVEMTCSKSKRLTAGIFYYVRDNQTRQPGYERTRTRESGDKRKQCQPLARSTASPWILHCTERVSDLA